MILRELVDYYDYLCANQPGAVVQRGWSKTRVSCFINLNEEGDLLGLIPVSERGGVLRYVPEQVKRSSGVAPNYLCDTPAYLLGFGAKGKPERAKRCFEASKALHMSLLKDVESPIAQAICRFYNRWSADDSLNNPAVCEQSDVLLAGRNLAFMVNGTEAIDEVN